MVLSSPYTDLPNNLFILCFWHFFDQILWVSLYGLESVYRDPICPYKICPLSESLVFSVRIPRHHCTPRYTDSPYTETPGIKLSGPNLSLKWVTGSRYTDSPYTETPVYLNSCKRYYNLLTFQYSTFLITLLPRLNSIFIAGSNNVKTYYRHETFFKPASSYSYFGNINNLVSYLCS